MRALFGKRKKGSSDINVATDGKEHPFQKGPEVRQQVPMLWLDKLSNQAEYEINGKAVGQLVTVSLLKDHLKLLNAFYHLRENVVNATGTVCGDGYTKETMFSTFVSMAVERYLIMTEKKNIDDYSIIPLDVMMVWHSYCLNPSAYRNDSLMDKSHGLPSCFPLSKYAKRLVRCRDYYKLEPSPEESEKWHKVTNTTFDPLEHFRTCKSRIITDPYTINQIEVPWITKDGHGYAQQDFQYPSWSGKVINHKVLGMRRFFEDMVKCIKNENIGIG